MNGWSLIIDWVVPLCWLYHGIRGSGWVCVMWCCLSVLLRGCDFRFVLFVRLADVAVLCLFDLVMLLLVDQVKIRWGNVRGWMGTARWLTLSISDLCREVPQSVDWLIAFLSFVYVLVQTFCLRLFWHTTLNRLEINANANAMLNANCNAKRLQRKEEFDVSWIGLAFTLRAWRLCRDARLGFAEVGFGLVWHHCWKLIDWLIDRSRLFVKVLCDGIAGSEWPGTYLYGHRCCKLGKPVAGMYVHVYVSFYLFFLGRCNLIALRFVCRGSKGALAWRLETGL